MIDGVGRDIISRRFAEGELMPKENELTEQFGVSRTSVREGMRVLAAKGLVDIRQKVGTRVRPAAEWNVFDADILRWHHEEGLGAAVLRDLVELRQIVEPQAARLAAGRATIEDQQRIRAALVQMRAAISEPGAYAQADVAFHQAVYAASQNVLLRQFGTVVADFMQLSFQLQQDAVMSASVAGAQLVLDVEQHAMVLAAIDRGNGERAADAMLDVVLDGKNALFTALKHQPGADTDQVDAGERGAE